MRSTPRGSWHLVTLALVAAAIAVAGVLEVGTPSSSARVSREVVTAENGVIQSTVSGSGNVEPGTEEFANFKTSGTLADVYVSVGQHVNAGQLLATLDPTSAQLAVDQAQLSLSAAQDDLTAAEDGASSSTGSGTGSAASTAVSPSTAEFVSDETRVPTNTPEKPSSKSNSSSQHSTSSASRAGNSSNNGSASSSAKTSTTTTPSPAEIASAQAQVDSAELTLRSAQTTLAETRLYAPASGTIVSLESTSPGDEISAANNSSASTGSSGSSGSSGSGSGSGGSNASTAGSLGGSSSSSSSGSGFAEIVNTGSMTMTVAFSESDITKVKVGQPATVTLDALTGVELAAHVSSISTLGTDSNGVVSYDATLTLDQSDSQVRPGMSATASVVTSQAHGVNLPNSAITGAGSLSTIELLKDGKSVSTPVVVGVKGDTRTQIISGLKAGQEVVMTTTLPSLSSSAAASSSSSGTLGGLRSRFGGGGGFGGGGALGGGGGAARLFGGG